MSRIRVLVQMSGPRGDGQPWPAPASMGGGTIEVSDGEAADLARAGIAEIIPEPEPAPPKPAKPEPAPPAVVAPKEERAVVTETAETRNPAGLTTHNAPVTRPRAARAKLT